MVNHKIVQRAIAKSLVSNTPELIKLVNKYKPVSRDISYADLLFTVQDLIENNPDFREKYTVLLLKNKNLKNYNNADGEKTNTNGSGQFGLGIVQGVSNVLSSIIDAGSAKKDRVVEQQKIASQNTGQILNFMMQEEQMKVSAQKNKDNLIYIAVGAMVVITGIIIITRKK